MSEVKAVISCWIPGCYRSQSVTVDVPEAWISVQGATPQLFALCPEHAKYVEERLSKKVKVKSD